MFFYNTFGIYLFHVNGCLWDICQAEFTPTPLITSGGVYVYWLIRTAVLLSVTLHVVLVLSVFCCMRICTDIWLMYIDYNIWCCIRLLSITRGYVFVYCSSSVGTIAGAVIGGLFALAVVIGIIVFICVVVCKCKTTGVRGRVVQPGVGVSNNVTYINSPSAPPYNSKSFDFCLVFAILYFLDMFELSIPLNNI